MTLFTLNSFENQNRNPQFVVTPAKISGIGIVCNGRIEREVKVRKNTLCVEIAAVLLVHN